MEFSQKPKVIKIQPMRDQQLFYEPGDILLAGTDKFKPWPCIVRQFLGYDESEVQVYRVDFLCSNEYCNLETEYLIPITKTKLQRLRMSRYYGYKRQKYMKALSVAEKKIREIEYHAKDDDQMMHRFMRLYQSDQHEVNGFIQVDGFKKQAQGELLLKQKRQKRLRLRFCRLMNVSIFTERAKNLVTSVIQCDGKIFSTNWKVLAVQKDQVIDKEITVEIRNWSPNGQMEEQ